MSGTEAALFVAGIALLIGGAEVLVRGSAGLAARLGIPPVVVGLTVVAFGTSSPEMAVSVAAAAGGQPEIALGNVVGSNILNVLLVLGIAAVVAPLAVARRLVVLDVPLLIGISGVAWLMAADGRIGRLEGVALCSGAVAYTAFLLHRSRRERAAPGEGKAHLASDPWPLQLALVVGGLAALVLGSRWLVAGAVAIARVAGLSELVIGLTVVAFGTSLPEVASSIVAAVRGQRDIAVGNAVGSNIFNLLAVLGAGAAVAPGGIAVARPALVFDIPVMFATALACLPILFTGHRIDRWEGGLFLAYYAAYTAFVVLSAQHSPTAARLGTFLLVFAIPLTVATLAALTVRAWSAQRRREGRR